jgi:hypothetical protein
VGALDFKAIHHAAFSTDGRGSYSVERVAGHWMAAYVERGKEPVDLCDGESFEEAVAACQRHNDAPKGGG